MRKCSLLFLLLLFVGCGEDTAVPTSSVKVSVEEALTAVHAKADAYRDCVITVSLPTMPRKTKTNKTAA